MSILLNSRNSVKRENLQFFLRKRINLFFSCKFVFYNLVIRKNIDSNYFVFPYFHKKIPVIWKYESFIKLSPGVMYPFAKSLFNVYFARIHCIVNDYITVVLAVRIFVSFVFYFHPLMFRSFCLIKIRAKLVVKWFRECLQHWHLARLQYYKHS